MLRKTRVRHFIFVFLIGFFCLLTQTMADYPLGGLSFTTPLVSKDPPDTHGYRASLWYQPKSFIWSQGQLYFDGSYGHWWVNTVPYYQTESIYAIAPVFRYYFVNHPYVSPFTDISIGLSYLTNTHFEDRNLGIHFAFQDEIDMGISIGKEKRLSLIVGILHYSNGGLSGWNSGITIPLVAKIQYGF
jgi:lipid A 3-O-deacylase